MGWNHTCVLMAAGCVSLTATGDLSNVDSLLGPLADNGGPTFTHALLPGSPAPFGPTEVIQSKI